MERIFYVLLILLCVACENDDSFSTSPGLQLDFSVDTLKLDTLFSKTPSSTYAFWVHNRNDQGLRLSTVGLKRGNQSGYRVNVDGVYLDNSNGSRTNNVEIRRKDSILVFVELTAPENKQKVPVLVEDDLVFNLESGKVQQVNLRAWAWDARKLYDPVIMKDSVIESEQPLVVFGDLKVAEGVTLTLRNTTLYFHDGAGILVDGTLKTENCMMRGDRLDLMFDYLPYDRVSGQWNGARFTKTSNDNYLIDTEIRSSVEGIVCDSAILDETRYRLDMQNCIVHNSQGTGVRTVNANVRLDHCQLTNAGGDCLAVYGGKAEVTYCTIAQFYPFSADRGAALRFTNAWGGKGVELDIEVTGCIVTGYEENVIMGEMMDEGKAYDYIFYNCLLRKLREEDSAHFTDIIWETPKDEVQGKDHFVKIDEEKQAYDFHLSEKSTAKGLGCY
jgi:hypothetical protein